MAYVTGGEIDHPQQGWEAVALSQEMCDRGIGKCDSDMENSLGFPKLKEFCQIGERSIWRVSIISETFWGIINFFVLFFTTLVQPSKGRSEYSNGSGRRPDGPDFPRRRMGGFNNRGGGGPASPPMGGGG